MDHSENRIMAGLIFVGEKRIDLMEAVSRTATALKGLCQDVRSLGFLSDMDAGVETENYRICLTVSNNVIVPGLYVRANVLLRIDVSRLNDAVKETEPSIDVVLARVAINLNDHLRPEHLQWVDEDAILTADEVSAAGGLTANVASTPVAAPRDEDQLKRARAVLTDKDDPGSSTGQRRKPAQRIKRKPAPPSVCTSFDDGIIEPTPESISPQLDNIAEENDRLRLSAWLISIGVTCIALPVGVALMIINLARGENLRLAGQTAAVSGLFVSLQANGATAQALQTVQSVLP